MGVLDGEEEERWIAKSLAAGMYGSSLVAVASGVLADFVVGKAGKMRPMWEDGNVVYCGGYIAAFDACLPVLACCAAAIAVMWEENYGGAASEGGGAPTVDGSKRATNGVGMTPRKLDYGFAKKHSSVNHSGNKDESDRDEMNNALLLHEVESQTNGRSAKAKSGKNQQHHQEGMFVTLWNGMVTVWRSPPILMCCIIASFFEGAM